MDRPHNCHYQSLSEGAVILQRDMQPGSRTWSIIFVKSNVEGGCWALNIAPAHIEGNALVCLAQLISQYIKFSCMCSLITPSYCVPIPLLYKTGQLQSTHFYTDCQSAIYSTLPSVAPFGKCQPVISVMDESYTVFKIWRGDDVNKCV